ncbi:hypothetical protein C0J26_01925 [Pseudomonas baetica]|nr:hypothetical protein C0J26_01925 [Pseudomonas baetica]
MAGAARHSRASPLPHWIFSGRQFCGHHNSLWERACSRRRPIGRQKSGATIHSVSNYAKPGT